MLLDRVPPEAELQADLDVGVSLGVELLSTPEVVVREAALAAGGVALPDGRQPSPWKLMCRPVERSLGRTCRWAPDRVSAASSPR